MKERASLQKHAIEPSEPDPLERILVVARQPRRLAAQLQAPGEDRADCQITTTASIAAGRAVLLELMPHALVLDLRLGRDEMFDWIRQVRADPLRSQLPVMAIGSSSAASERRQALAVGCHDYVANPVDPAAMAASLASLLRRSDAPPEDTAVRRVRRPRPPSEGDLDALGLNTGLTAAISRARKPRSRRSERRPDDVAVVLWLSKQEHARVLRLAADQGLEPAEWVRLRAASADGAHSLEATPAPKRKPAPSKNPSEAAVVGDHPAPTWERLHQGTLRRVVALLMRDGKLFPRFIAERLGISRARAWNALTTLESSGHVRRAGVDVLSFEATGKPLDTDG